MLYSAVPGLCPVEELAQLANGPTGCSGGARGWCLFQWNFSVKGQFCLCRRRGLDQTRRCRRVGDSLLAYGLKIPPAKYHALHYISARHVCVPGNVNGVNVIGLALQGPSVPGLQLVNSGSGRPPSTLDIGYTYQHPLQARGPTREYATNKGKPGSIKLTTVV